MISPPSGNTHEIYIYISSQWLPLKTLLLVLKKDYTSQNTFEDENLKKIVITDCIMQSGLKITKWDFILLVWITKYCGYKAAWSLNYELHKQYAKGETRRSGWRCRSRRDSRQDRHKGSEVAWGDQEQQLGSGWQVRKQGKELCSQQLLLLKGCNDGNKLKGAWTCS